MRSIFDLLPRAIKRGIYDRVDARPDEGPQTKSSTEVFVIITEAHTTRQPDYAGSPQTSIQDSVLIYGMPGSPLADPSCIGGRITVDGTSYSIDGWAPGRDQWHGDTPHYEVACHRIAQQHDRERGWADAYAYDGNR